MELLYITSNTYIKKEEKREREREREREQSLFVYNVF